MIDFHNPKMEYTLCSSSEEEGQLTPTTTFPTKTSVLQHCYYPNTQLFVGDNTIPRKSDFPDGEMTLRMKKKIKKEYFDMMGMYKDKAFFDNKFQRVASIASQNAAAEDIKQKHAAAPPNEEHEKYEHITRNPFIRSSNKEESGKDTYNNTDSDATKLPHKLSDMSAVKNDTVNTTRKQEDIVIKDCTATLLKVESDYKQISAFSILKKGTDPYLTLFNNLIYHKNMSNVVIIKDSILNKAQNDNVFIHFKVLKSNNMLFEDVYYKNVDAYEYLEMYFEETCKEYKSTEHRWYKLDCYELVVFSSTVFYTDGHLMRYYNGLDCTKNFLASLNKNKIETRMVNCGNVVTSSFINAIIDLKLPDGDYAHNKGVIYKLGLEGDRIEYEGINYKLAN